MANIYRTQMLTRGFEFDTATGIVKDMRGSTATLNHDAAKALAFTLDLLEKYEDTSIGKLAQFHALETAFAFWED